MKKRSILVFVRNRTASAFLEAFFKKSEKYLSVACRTPSSVREQLAANGHTALITDVGMLAHAAPATGAIPLIVLTGNDRNRGILAATAHHADRYITPPFLDSDLEHALLSVVEKTASVGRLKQEVRDLRVVNELSQLISSTLDPKELLYRIVKKISDIMPVTRCSIIRIDWLHKFAYVVASYETPGIATIKLSLKKYPEIIEALVKKKPVIVSDIAKDPLMAPVREIISPLGIRSILVMPIMFEQKVIGTLFLRTSRKRRSFSKNEIRLLQTLADASSNTLNNAFLFAQVEDEKTRLEKLAITDYLTGIYNVRYFYHRIIEEFSRSNRYGLPISCLMLDIDYFKKINDTHGHKVGDQVLKEFALKLKQHSRKSDVLARYGGEEFIVMLPQTTAEGALAEAQRIRRAIRSYKFKALRRRGTVTISIGIATFPNSRIKTHDDLISAADDALYEAKNSGRDRVIVYT